MRRFCLTQLVVALAYAVLGLTPVAAQESAGIAGTVKDVNGGVLPGALVEVQPLGKKVVSDALGDYSIPYVPAGEYTLTASYVGFATFSTTVKVTAGQQTNADAVLKVDRKSTRLNSSHRL